MSCTNLVFELLLKRLNLVVQGLFSLLVGFLHLLQLLLQCWNL